MDVLFSLCVLQVQTLYYSADHKLVDGGLVIEGHTEVFGGEEDHLQFVQVHCSSVPGLAPLLALPVWARPPTGSARLA